jgi:hypothetical protein
MPFVEENINFFFLKKRSLNAIISISSKKPLLPLNVAVFFPSQSKHLVQEITHVQRRPTNPTNVRVYVISRSVDLEDSPDFTASVEEYVAQPQVVQQRTPPPTV